MPLCGHSYSGGAVSVQHATYFWARFMYCAMYHKGRWVDCKIDIFNQVPVYVYLD